MNKLIFIYKFLIKKHDSKKFNWSFLFPFVGVIIGSTVIFLTVAIMEGMEKTIFSKLEQLSFSYKLDNINKNDFNQIKSIIKHVDINRSLKDQVIISNNINYRVVNMIGMDDYNEFSKNVLNNNLISSIDINNFNKIYIGKNLASRLNVIIGDSVFITNSKTINIFTGIPETIKVIVHGIFDINLIDFNQNYIYSNYDLINSLYQPDDFSILLNEELDNEYLALIENINDKISYSKWDDEYTSFISAMKLEKIIYSLIGFLIILISAFTLVSTMSLSVMKKIPQLGILISIGMKAKEVIYVFLFQSILTGLLGISIGLMLSFSVIYFDNKFEIVKFLFKDQLVFDFSLILTNVNISIISSISLIILILSGLYPSFKAAKINLIQSIGYKK